MRLTTSGELEVLGAAFDRGRSGIRRPNDGRLTRLSATPFMPLPGQLHENRLGAISLLRIAPSLLYTYHPKSSKILLLHFQLVIAPPLATSPAL